MSRRKCDCSLNGVGKQCRHLRSFEKLVTALAPSLSSLKVIAVSLFCCLNILDVISSLSSFLSGDLITVGIIRDHNLGGLSQVSVPDLGESMIPTLTEMHSVLLPSLQSLNLWQVGLLPVSYDFVICGL